jgi:hypothetical protein
MFVLWFVLPYLIAAAVTSMHKKLSAAEDPWTEATRIGRELTNDLRKALKEQT